MKSYLTKLTLFTLLAISGKLLCSTYKSQHGQDKFLNTNIFKNSKNGTFVEIGAHDGVQYSNTWFFEKELGWTGLCIEPRTVAYNGLVKNRDCTCVKCAITSENGPIIFRECHGAGGIQFYSGIESKYDPRQIKRIKEKINTINSDCKIITVEGHKLNDLLQDNNISNIDYISIDTEGGELEILKSIDYENVYIYIIDVENHFFEDKLCDFLSSKGFKKIATLAFNEIYMNTKPYQGNLRAIGKEK